MEGKILCVVGAPRTGKSFLVRKLAEHYTATPFFEGEEVDFPERIREDIAKNIRPLERVLWFRNKLTSQYAQALEVRRLGGVAILDNAYFAVDPYIDVITQDPFEREILHSLARSDERALGFPDTIVHLVSSEKKIKEFITAGARAFDSSENYYTEHVLPVQKVWSERLSIMKGVPVIELHRADLDFENSVDLKKVTDRIDAVTI